MVRKKLIVVIVAIVLLVVALWAGYVLLTQTPPGTPPGAAPTVTFTSPASAATGVPINTKILASFSEAMDASTITT